MTSGARGLTKNVSLVMMLSYELSFSIAPDGTTAGTANGQNASTKPQGTSATGQTV